MAANDTPWALGALALTLAVTLAGCAVAGVPLVEPSPYTDTGAALDGDALREDHTTTLESAESFRTTSNVSVTADADPIVVNRTAAVDGDRARSTARLASGALDDGGLTVTSYTEGNTTARLVVIAGDSGELVRYDAAREPYDDGLLSVSPVDRTRAAEGDLAETAVEEVEWTQRGVERHDGTWVTRYEATGTENVSDLGTIVGAAVTDADLERTGLTADALDVDSVDATLLVSQDGVVREFSITVVATTDDGETVTMELTATTTGVDATPVHRPAWYEEATEGLEG